MVGVLHRWSLGRLRYSRRDPVDGVDTLRTVKLGPAKSRVAFCAFGFWRLGFV